jgi:hypothetical protein
VNNSSAYQTARGRGVWFVWAANNTGSEAANAAESKRNAGDNFYLELESVAASFARVNRRSANREGCDSHAAL